ncbi:Abscisic acid G-protein coupled receptor-domain-containing protein [Geopyxis carbonaria]|nr:Abscisic acid G-protein coupled receptor-domain-containing protein [Geopyxis carbonaria]
MSPHAAAAASKCTDDAGGSCTPPGLPSHAPLALLFSALPFILTFSLVSLLVLHRLFPALCGAGSRHHSADGRLRRRVAALAFSTTLGATGVLAELVLCEVGGWMGVGARRLAFRVVVAMLLVCLIVVIPLLELHSLVEASALARWGRRGQLAGVALAFGGWLWVFWSLGDRLPIRNAEMRVWTSSRTMSEECLARVGVVGVSLMALLSGFGCVSTPWQSFGAKSRPVTDSDVERARSGLDATHDLLATKRAQLRVLERKIADKKATGEGLVSKMMSAVRSDADTQEYTTLLSETAGLETMGSALAAELTALTHRQTEQTHLKTPTGRLLSTIYLFFSLYCLYRIAATTLAHLPFIHHTRSFSQNDPINNILALLAKHWDPHLDRAAWSRQISFLMSGVIIAGSLSSVRTTVTMLARTAPPVFSAASDSPALALAVSQLSAVYVLASALLLRSNLPPQMGSVISEALGAPLDPAFVDRWFDRLFLGAAGATAVVLIVGRKVAGWGAEEEVDVEAGKQC